MTRLERLAYRASRVQPTLYKVRSINNNIVWVLYVAHFNVRTFLFYKTDKKSKITKKGMFIDYKLHFHLETLSFVT